MSKLKRMKRRRALQKQANIREMASKRTSKATLGSDKLMKRMARDHQDVLQNIEFALVSGYRENHSIDDYIVADALEAAIQGNVPEDSHAISLNEALEDIRQLGSDVSDDIWKDGLRIVLQPVHWHSSLKPGCRWYLDFASQFIL